jgi:hypothetical protein
MAKQIIVAHFVTEAQAEAVLAAVRPWLRDPPPIDQFREQLDATVEPIWASQCAADHYRAVGRALAELGPSAQRAKTVLRAMEESAASPQMVNYADLLKLDVVRPVLVALDKLERALAPVPVAFSGQQKPAKGPAPRAWYSRFFRDLAKIANGLGIEVTTQGDRERDPYATPFTRFVFAVEKLLPRKAQSSSLVACAKQIERATKASAHEISVEQAFKAYAREIGIEFAFEADAGKIRRKRKPSNPAYRLRDK